ncbi:MAG: glycosyltransferase family 1 protein [Solirubrobacteraceae bacterium]
MDGAAALRTGLELTLRELDSGGTARAALSLMRALEVRDDVDVVPIAQPGASRAGSRGQITRGIAREMTWLPARLALQARRLKLDVLHCPGPLVPARSPVPLVVTIFDALPWRHPEWLTPANVASHRLVVRRGVRRAEAVITSSLHARGEIADAYGIEPERIHVVPLGVDDAFTPGEASDRVLARLGVTGPFVLTVGTLQPRKNIGAVVSAFERLVAQGANLALVVTGGAGWGGQETAERIRRSPAADRVVMTGHVGDAELLALYRGALCFVFPSRYEGFGLPVLEAMAAGTPVVCSDRTSLPEVAGAAATLVSPDDVDALERAIGRVASSPDARAEMVERGLMQAARFTWERCAQETVGVYRTAISTA